MARRLPRIASFLYEAPKRTLTFFFSDPLAVDGTRVPSKCVLLGKSGKERMRTELRDIRRLPTLPPKPESKSATKHP